MNSVKIRRAHLGDADGIYAVEVISFPTPWSRAAFTAELSDNDLAYYLIAERNGQIIGYAGMWIIVDEAHVTNVAITPEFRGQGVGILLMKALVEKAKEKGACRMTLEVRPTNAVAQQLYGKLGFVKKGIRRQYYSDNKEDAHVMWLDPID